MSKEKEVQSSLTTRHTTCEMPNVIQTLNPTLSSYTFFRAKLIRLPKMNWLLWASSELLKTIYIQDVLIKIQDFKTKLLDTHWKSLNYNANFQQ